MTYDDIKEGNFRKCSQCGRKVNTGEPMLKNICKNCWTEQDYKEMWG